MRTLPKSHRKIYESNTFSFVMLYYLQGIPFSLQTRYLPLLLRENGETLFNIGLYKLAIVPWTFKILWAPMSALRGDGRRKWLNASLAGLTFLSLILSRSPPWSTSCFIPALIMYNVMASLSDVALDTLVDEVSEARRVYYADSIQFAGNCAGALTVGMVACITDHIKWQGIFAGLAALYFIGLVDSTSILPLWQTPRSRRKLLSKSSVRRTRRSVSQDLDCSLDNGQESYYSIKFTRSYMTKLLKVDGSWWMLHMLLVYKIGEFTGLTLSSSVETT